MVETVIYGMRPYLMKLSFVGFGASIGWCHLRGFSTFMSVSTVQSLHMCAGDDTFKWENGLAMHACEIRLCFKTGLLGKSINFC